MPFGDNASVTVFRAGGAFRMSLMRRGVENMGTYLAGPVAAAGTVHEARPRIFT